MTSATIIDQILELGRWAPSGDNTQPWRFEIVDALHLVVHGFDTRKHCVYDLDGHPSQISIGALLETISIAASLHGLLMQATRRLGVSEFSLTFDVLFVPNMSVTPDPLVQAIPLRSVQRRPMKTRALNSLEKQLLESSTGADYKIFWIASFADKLTTALLMFESAKLRLTMPEAYSVHQNVIHWGSKYSNDRIPDQALGIDPLTVRLMQFVMHSWKRVEFFNKFLAGTWIPRIQMDFVPSLACAAHFVIYAKISPVTIDDYVAAGRAMQRFWLTVADLGLVMQPEMTPLIFARYATQGIHFSKISGMQARAGRLAAQLERLVGSEVAASGVFMGRLGEGLVPKSRSMRRELIDLKNFQRQSLRSLQISSNEAQEIVI